MTCATFHGLAVSGRDALMRKSAAPMFTTVVVNFNAWVPSAGFETASAVMLVIARSGNGVPAGGPVTHAAATAATAAATAMSFNRIDPTPRAQERTTVRAPARA